VSEAPPERPVERARRRAAAQKLVVLGVAAAASGGTAALILTGHKVIAGLAGAVAGLGLLAGHPALGPGYVRPRLAARLLDRVVDACVLVPLAWTSRSADSRLSLLALAGLSTAYVAAYERARGESLGYRGSEGPGYRGTRVAILVFGLVTGWLEASLLAFLALSTSAAAVRVVNVARQDRRTVTSSMEGPPVASGGRARRW
jgi:hypothetical protein